MLPRRIFLAGALVATLTLPAAAESTWDELRPLVFGDAVPVLEPSVVQLTAPYRTYDDPRTDIGARIDMPFGEFIETVTLILDDNPMPVSAVFDLTTPQPSFEFSATMRVNGPTMVRVVVETDRGNFYMAENFVKTSGTGACAAPPGTDPAEALATLGTMEFGLVAEVDTGIVASLEPPTASSISGPSGRLAQLDIDHPSHSGMQMDQITLLFIPARYVDTVAVEADGTPIFNLTGSISLSENPAVRFRIPEDSVTLGVRMTDTEGAVFENTFNLPGG
ncbi:MAG: quinoprotein dehydrogenase-associated SoxYZ-like carrier [Pseudomonadota bacterium]